MMKRFIAVSLAFTFLFYNLEFSSSASNILQASSTTSPYPKPPYATSYSTGNYSPSFALPSQPTTSAQGYQPNTPQAQPTQGHVYDLTPSSYQPYQPGGQFVQGQPPSYQPGIQYQPQSNTSWQGYQPNTPQPQPQGQVYDLAPPTSQSYQPGSQPAQGQGLSYQSGIQYQSPRPTTTWQGYQPNNPQAQPPQYQVQGQTPQPAGQSTQGYPIQNQFPGPGAIQQPSPTTQNNQVFGLGPAPANNPGATQQQQTVSVSLGTPDISTIEQALSMLPPGMDNAQPQPSSDTRLTQFGYDFFMPGATAFTPNIDTPVGPDYHIGVGDQIMLTLWGSLEGTYELDVNRSGEVTLPKVGTVKILGLPFGQLTNVFRVNLAKAFKDIHFTINMGRLHLIKVYVVGEVKYPGDYTISSLSTVINALSAAGGPTKNGTLRNIKIKRKGVLNDTVDLYDFFLNGDKSRDISLHSGDTIYVPVIGPVAGVSGNVKRPGIYEVDKETCLKNLLDMAGSITPTGYLQHVQIFRVKANDKKIVANVDLAPNATGKSLDEMASKTSIQDMDLVRIMPIDSMLKGYVRIKGHVLHPGDYALEPGMHIRDLIPRDSLRPEYFPGAFEVTRLQSTDHHPTLLYANLEKALDGDPKNDLKLQEFDSVRVFSRWEMEEMPRVRIGGEVLMPGDYRFLPGMTVRDLVIEAGNPKLTAYFKNAEVTRIKKTANFATSVPINIDLQAAMQGDPKNNILLAPFDEITVRKIPDWVNDEDRYITLIGEFVFPGVYPVYKGETLSDVIKRAGGFTERAYLKGAKFTRRQVQEDQQKRMDEVITRTEQDISQKQSEMASTATSKDELEATKAALGSLMQTAEKLRNTRAEGRMVISLAEPDKLTGTLYDFQVAGADTLQVPNTPNSVNVLGQVYTPMTFLYIPGKTVDYYLKKAGGETPQGEVDSIYIIKADGSVFSRENNSGFFQFGSFMSTKLDAGDTLVVPQRIDHIAWERQIKDIATIFGQIALTAGVILGAGL